MGTPNFWRVLVILLFTICHQTLAAPYTKYGRSCSDIGCLPSEVCIMSQEACSFGQRDGKECGRYPTCKKGGSVPPTDNGAMSLNPAPSNTRYSQPTNIFTSHSSYPNNQNVNAPPFPGAFDPNSVFPSNSNPSYPNQPNQQMPQFPPGNGYGSLPTARPPQYPPDFNSNQPPFVFGQLPPNFYQSISNPGPTTKQPSLLDQFLYNKQPKNNSNMKQSSIYLTVSLSLLTLLACYIL